MVSSFIYLPFVYTGAFLTNNQRKTTTLARDIVMNETGGAKVDGKDWVMELPQIIAEDCGWVLKAGVTGSGGIWLWFPGQAGKSSLAPEKVAELDLKE